MRENGRLGMTGRNGRKCKLPERLQKMEGMDNPTNLVGFMSI